LRLKRRTVAFGFILVCVVLALLFSQRILWAMGAMLVASEPPVKADIIVTLAGDASGNRIFRAGELVRDGYAPQALVSGTLKTYGVLQSELEIDDAVRHGYPREYFVPFQHNALSTRDEAATVVPELRRRGVHKCLLVTSYYHTARAIRVYRRAAPDIEFHVTGTRFAQWNDGYWWREREGRKIWLEEEAKTVADFFGI